MTKDPDSIECPVCGRSVPSDAVSCPSCGADLSMSSLEELEKVAKSLSAGGPMPGGAPEPAKEEMGKAEPAKTKAETKEAKGEKALEPEKAGPKEEEEHKEGKRFGKLFGRRKK